MKLEDLTEEDKSLLGTFISQEVPSMLKEFHKQTIEALGPNWVNFSKEVINKFLNVPYQDIPLRLSLSNNYNERGIYLFRLSKGY